MEDEIDTNLEVIVETEQNENHLDNNDQERPNSPKQDFDYSNLSKQELVKLLNDEYESDEYQSYGIMDKIMKINEILFNKKWDEEENNYLVENEPKEVEEIEEKEEEEEEEEVKEKIEEKEETEEKHEVKEKTVKFEEEFNLNLNEVSEKPINENTINDVESEEKYDYEFTAEYEYEHSPDEFDNGVDTSVHDENLEKDDSTYKKSESESKKNLEEVEFEILGDGELVKYKQCTYGKTDNIGFFFLCNCQGEIYFPICEYCYKECHSEHVATKAEGVYYCFCGKFKHKKNEDKHKRSCLNTIFGNLIENPITTNYLGMSMCDMCYKDQSCMDYMSKYAYTEKMNAAQTIDGDIRNKKLNICVCQNHPKLNIYQLDKIRTDLIEKKLLKIPKLNYNVYTKNVFIRRESFDDLINSIEIDNKIKGWNTVKEQIIKPYQEKLNFCDELYQMDKKFDLDKLNLSLTNHPEQIENLSEFFLEFLKKILNKIPENLKVKSNLPKMPININKPIENLKEIVKYLLTLYRYLKCLEENFFEEYKLKSNLEFFKYLCDSNSYRFIPFDLTKMLNRLELNETEARSLFLNKLSIDNDNQTTAPTTTYYENKILLSNFVFHVFFKSRLIDSGPINLSFSSIVNMNIIQRIIYLHWNKDFFKFTSKLKINIEKKPDLSSKQEVEELKILYDDLEKFVNIIISIFKSITGQSDLTYKINLLPINKIIKKLIKRNLVANNHLNEYLDLYDELLRECKENKNKEIIHNRQNSDTLMKIIFYSLLNKNDMVFYSKFKDLGSSDTLPWAYKKNPDSQKLCCIFFKNIYNYDTYTHPQTNDFPSKKIEFVIQKIFFLLSDDKYFFEESISNLNFMDISIYNIFKENRQEDFHKKIYEHFEKPGIEMTNYVDIIQNFSLYLMELNNNYFFYNSEFMFKEYINKFEEKWKIITKSIKSWIPLNKKYHSIKSRDKQDDILRQNTRNVQEAVKFTHFFQAINGFFHIYAININENRGSSENISFLLYFLYLLIKDNDENYVLLTTIDNKNFIKVFLKYEECHKNFFCLLENISENLFSKKQSKCQKFDTHEFFCTLIQNLILMIEYDKPSEDTKNFKIISHIFKLSRKFLKRIGMNVFLGIQLIKDVLKTIDNLKKNEHFNTYGILEFQLSRRSSSHHVLNMMKNYFKFMNEFMISELQVLGFLDKSLYLWYSLGKLNLIMSEFFDVNSFLPIKIRIIILEHIDKFYVYPEYHNKNSEISILYFLKDEKYLRPRMHYSFDGIEDYEKIYPKTFFKKFNEKIVDHFINLRLPKAGDIIQEAHLIAELIPRRITLFQYFENIIIRPSFFIINEYLQNIEDLKGEESKNIYLITKRIIHLAKEFYSIIGSTDIMKDKDEDKIIFDSLDLFSMENIHLIFPKKDDLMKNIKLLERDINNCKNYELDKIVKIYRTLINLIILPDDVLLGEEKTEVPEKTKDDEFPCENFKSNKESINYHEEETNENDKLIPLIYKKLNDTDLIKEKMDLLSVTESDITLKKREKLIENILSQYNQEAKRCPDLEKVMNYEIHKSENEDFSEYLKNIVFYLFTNAYIRIHNNYYFLTYRYIQILNNLFQQFSSIMQSTMKRFFRSDRLGSRCYSEKEEDKIKFQQTFKSLADENTDTGFIFISLLLTKFVTPIIINNAIKLHTLKYIYPYDLFSLEATKSTLKFIQNLCEDHNPHFQEGILNFNLPRYLYETTNELKELNDSYQKSLELIDSSLATNSLNRDILDKKKFINENLDFIKAIKYWWEPNKNVNSKDPHDLDLIYYFNVYDSILSISNNANLFKELNNIRDENKKREKILEILETHKYNPVLDQLRCMQKNRLNFFNYIFILLKMIIFNSKFSGSQQNLQFDNKSLILLKPIEELNNSLKDLIIEIIQTYDGKYNSYFYNKIILEEVIDPNKDRFISRNFYFIEYLKVMKDLFDGDQSIFYKDSFQIKLSLFELLNNIINQYNNSNRNIIKIIFEVFSLEKLIKLMYLYTIELFKNHLNLKIKFTSEEYFEHTTIIKKDLQKMLHDYRQIDYKDDSSKISVDPNFKLASSIFLLLIKIKEQYKNQDVENYFKKNQIYLFRERILNIRKLPENEMVDIINFYTSLIRKVEFSFIYDNMNMDDENGDGANQTYNDEEDKADEDESQGNVENENIGQIKTIYFYPISRSFLATNQKKKITDFLNNVDRNSPTTKLREFINFLERINSDLALQDDLIKDAKSDDWIKSLSYDFSKVDKINIVISCVINLILFLYLNNGSLDYLQNYILLFLALSQTLINAYFFYLFFTSKYIYLIKIEKNSVRWSSYNGIFNFLNLKNIFNLYVLQAFNKELIFMYLNFFTSLFYLIFSNLIILFPLQLFGFINFIETIREIYKAFLLTNKQILSMIGFLAILILIYATIGFYFMYDMFNLTLGNGTNENMCSSLLSCFMLYFNFGIRSGGGIGDIINPEPYSNFHSYIFLWVIDMIFYITTNLLIMNMINGMIITTFGALREENEKYREDKENLCFICSCKRIIFESNKLSFEDHKKYEHNIRDYIEYYITIKNIGEQDLNSDESQIMSLLNDRQISIFPVERCYSLIEEGIYQTSLII